MFDPTIHARSIARQFIPGDFVQDPSLLNEAYRKTIVDAAVQIGVNGFVTVAFATSSLRGKAINRVVDMAQLLVLRQISKNIRRLTGAKQDNRQFIIECIRTILREGTSYRVYKFDIKSFYESADVSFILNRLKTDEGFSGQSADALDTFFNIAQHVGISGLPRGLGLSATLAEYLLHSFDEAISNSTNVWFYARFVDDIFIVTSGRENRDDFLRQAKTSLPEGLEFNKKAKYLILIDLQKVLLV